MRGKSSEGNKRRLRLGKEIMVFTGYSQKAATSDS